ncbi:MGMT family protein [Chitinibacteraceae bacterium HSL-7]
MDSAATVRARMRAWVAKVPYGRVATYGDIARLAGAPRHARQVGLALRESAQDLPWHRIVNQQGKVSARGLDGSDDLQRVLLEAEGVEFDGAGRLSLRRHRWQPD